MKCYLAGPMRTKPGFNYEAFMDGASDLRSRGWVVFNPAEMDIELDDQADGFAEMTIEKQKEHADSPATARRYAKRDTDILLYELRAEDGDAIVMLPDWEESIGAKAEYRVAVWVGLKTLTLEEALNV